MKREIDDGVPAAARPLPPGYLWRLAVIVLLFGGAAASFVFFNLYIGAGLSLAGFAFGRLSGLNRMIDQHERDGGGTPHG